MPFGLSLIGFVSLTSFLMVTASAATFWNHVLINLGGLAVILLGSTLVLLRVILPLRQLSRAIGAEDQRRAIPGIGRGDEIGAIARAIAAYRDQQGEIADLRRQQESERNRLEDAAQAEMLALTEALENEVRETVGEVSVQAARLTQNATQLSQTAAALRSMAHEVSGLVEATSRNVETVASATEELEASSRSISEQIDSSAKLAAHARDGAEIANQCVTGLAETAGSIGNVVTMIQDIAARTRMLALNATIEAARAGDLGRGFAVVADEVKSLARQTEEGIATVNSQAGEITQSTGKAVETVTVVARGIRDIDAVTAEVARAAEEQRAATAEIMASASGAAQATRSVAGNVARMLEGVEATGRNADQVNDLSSLVNRDIAALQHRLYVILRSSAGGNRRDSARRTAAIGFRGDFGGQVITGFTGDVSEAGVLLVADGNVEMKPGPGMLELKDVGRFEAHLVAQDPLGIHVEFINPGKTELAALEECKRVASREDEPFMILAGEVAAQASAALEAALKDRSITTEDLFNIEYTPIDGTNPPQVMARHTLLVERLFPAIIEPALLRDARLVFCCITDRKGHIAAHNKKYSHPQRAGDVVWNTANSRNRRIFSDRAGTLAGRATKTLVQTYARDMGGGKFVVLKEIDAPIKAGGKHWGAVRMALKLV